MLRCGCKYEKATISYYTDSHEAESTKKDLKERYLYLMKAFTILLRNQQFNVYLMAINRYGPAQLQASLWLPEWIEVPLASATPMALENREKILKACSIDPAIPSPTADDPNPTVKIHLDYLNEEVHEKYRAEMMTRTGRPGEYYYDLGAPEWNDLPCRRRHDPALCKCRLPLYHVGQDEAIFKQFAMPSSCWNVKGMIKLRQKSEGMGNMVSGFFDEWRGFGLRLTDEEIVLVNNVRKERYLQSGTAPRKDIELGSSPGLIFFEYGNGKGKQGYWDGIKFQEQCIDFMDVVEIIYPGMQMLLEVDHSSGHLKEQTDGLMVNAMGCNWGGKTNPKRDSVMEEGCLGPDPPSINGVALTIGMTQRMIFGPDDPPPFNDLKALPFDRPMTEVEVAKEQSKRLKKSQNSNEEEAREEVADAPFVVLGYVGKNKGIFQVSRV